MCRIAAARPLQDFILTNPPPRAHADDKEEEEAPSAKIRAMDMDDFRAVLNDMSRTEDNASRFKVKRVGSQQDEEESSSFALGFKMGYEIAQKQNGVTGPVNLD